MGSNQAPRRPPHRRSPRGLAPWIPLKTGWNLFSAPLAVCWHVGGVAPSVPLVQGTAVQPVASLKDVLSSIDGKYTALRAFDATGARSFLPAAPDAYSDLTYLAGGYGYWIQMTEDAELVLEGAPLFETSTRQLGAGWNLVGYWGNDCRYMGEKPAGVFRPDVTYAPVDLLRTVFHSLGDNLRYVRGFDGTGAHVYDAVVPEAFNDLIYVGPGYGYWLRLAAPAAVSY